jgi:hypothetical protein
MSSRPVERVSLSATSERHSAWLVARTVVCAWARIGVHRSARGCKPSGEVRASYPNAGRESAIVYVHRASSQGRRR